ncbi:acyltransferase domain-containing protein [Pseudomonas batumici]|uniref:BatH n=2 Tax=Pseudomonas TaxID=286 RepID=D4NZE3_PSEFL|nr:acyltransferase domain-containing protein [Pseudomonas batumici]ADD82949.1 BatH [Pseudomonas fluorescens]KIH86014.1 BatH, batumin synthesis operon, malonyl CoA-acyl carrier protein transacylase [Pseudomonas batumici]
MSTVATVFMFSGQGSQYYGMGRELFARQGDFRDAMVSMDDVFRQLSGHSVIEMLYEGGRGKGETFDRTLFSSAAIFMVEYALAQALIRAGVVPDITLGASAGSFAAAAVAGFIDVEDALAAVVMQAGIFEKHCEPGGMLAILAEPELYTQRQLESVCEVAAVNFSSHFVVSALQPALIGIRDELRRLDIICEPLPVSYAFHSKWIDCARAPHEALMRTVRFRPGTLPLMCCDQADLMVNLPENYFWHAARHPIRFREAISNLERRSAWRYIDVGPAGTLATFLKYGLPVASTSEVHSVLTPYGHDVRNFNALLTRIGVAAC